MIAKSGAPAGEAVEIEDAMIGGLAVTASGLAALTFDANDEPLWAAVTRVGFDGESPTTTDLFRSPNLEEEKAPRANRARAASGYLGFERFARRLLRAHRDVLTGRQSRPPSGRLPRVSERERRNETVHSEWFGSHNLDQRLLVDGDRAALLGLGDARTWGIFFSYHDEPETDVAQQLAANGVRRHQRTARRARRSRRAAPRAFITDRALSPDFDPGEWPNGDEAKIEEVREAANHGKDLGFFLVDKEGGVPEGGIEPIWIESGRSGDASLENLKAAPYGSGGLVLLI